MQLNKFTNAGVSGNAVGEGRSFGPRPLHIPGRLSRSGAQPWASAGSKGSSGEPRSGSGSPSHNGVAGGDGQGASGRSRSSVNSSSTWGRAGSVGSGSVSSSKYSNSVGGSSAGGSSVGGSSGISFHGAGSSGTRIGNSINRTLVHHGKSVRGERGQRSESDRESESESSEGSSSTFSSGSSVLGKGGDAGFHTKGGGGGEGVEGGRGLVASGVAEGFEQRALQVSVLLVCVYVCVRCCEVLL